MEFAIPALDRGGRKRLNRLLIDMYAGDFSEDMEMLMLLLDELKIGEQRLKRCKEKLVRNERNNINNLFKQGYEKLRRMPTLGTRGNSLAKSGRPKAGETSVRSEVSELSEGPNASSLWWRTPTVSLC